MKAVRTIMVSLALFSVCLGASAIPSRVQAAEPYKSNNKGECKDGDIKLAVPFDGQKDCIPDKKTPGDNAIYTYIRGIVGFASGIFGLLVIGMIIWSGYLYITSQGNSEQYKTAKSRLTQAITGLVLFILMYGILEYLIPGGVLN